jgi:hypothetical protein
MSPSPHSFHYRACAHAFSANFTRPFQQNLEIQAPISLPTIGGHGHSSVENFRFREFVSFKRAYTHVSGSQAEDGSYNTLVIASVEGLNILDVVTADRVVARIRSKHFKDAAEGEISLAGSKFENLKISCCPVKVDLDFDLFEQILTFEKAKTSIDKIRRISSAPRGGDHTPIACTCIRELKVECPGMKPERHGFHVDGFGNIFLGEVMIKHGEKTLTMIRLELGSAVAGSGTVVEASSNGSPYPPTK